MWSANDGAARDLSKTLLEPVSIQLFFDKKTQISGISNPKLTLCWAGNTANFGFFQKADTAGSRWIPACPIIDRPHIFRTSSISTFDITKAM